MEIIQKQESCNDTEMDAVHRLFQLERLTQTEQVKNGDCTDAAQHQEKLP